MHSWGDGSKGQLGHNDKQSLVEPKIISALHDLAITNVTAGGNQSAFLNGIKIQFSSFLNKINFQIQILAGI